jgi:Glycosyl hydrolase family 26
VTAVLAVGVAVAASNDSEDPPAVPEGPTSAAPAPEPPGSPPVGPPSRAHKPGEAPGVSVPPGEPEQGPDRPEDPAPDASWSAPAGSSLGVYIGARNVEGVRQFGAWLGNDLDRALDYIDGSTWETIESPDWSTSGWADSGYRVDFSVPMIPDTGGSLRSGASGAYNARFAELAETLIENGQANAIIRPGWEFNLPLFNWSAGSEPRAYAVYFRQIVSTMRSVPGQAFEFEWSPALGRGVIPPDRAYPGDRYVDYIGLDVYDNTLIGKRRDPVARWRHLMRQPYGLRWHRDFSARHGKWMTFPEWGLVDGPSTAAGGDNPLFVQRMYAWISSNPVANHYYFEFDGSLGDHELLGGQFPRAAARFRHLFGA